MYLYSGVLSVCAPLLTAFLFLTTQAILCAEPSHTGRQCLKTTMRTLLRVAKSYGTLISSPDSGRTDAYVGCWFLAWLYCNSVYASYSFIWYSTSVLDLFSDTYSCSYWQWWVKNQRYSVSYFDCATVFKTWYLWPYIRGGFQMCCIHAVTIDTITRVFGPHP